MHTAVARMSEAISGSGGAGFTIDPGCRFAHPGYEEKKKKKEKKKETERRETRSHDPRHAQRALPRVHAAGAAPPPPFPPPLAGEGRVGAARLSAFHRGSRRPVVTLPAQLQARLPGTRTLGLR